MPERLSCLVHMSDDGPCQGVDQGAEPREAGAAEPGEDGRPDRVAARGRGSEGQGRGYSGHGGWGGDRVGSTAPIPTRFKPKTLSPGPSLTCWPATACLSCGDRRVWRRRPRPVESCPASWPTSATPRQVRTMTLVRPMWHGGGVWLRSCCCHCSLLLLLSWWRYGDKYDAGVFEP